MRFCFGTVMCFHFSATMQWLSLKCSRRGFPSYRGLICFFFWPIGGTIFLKLQGKIIAVPPPDKFSKFLEGALGTIGKNKNLLKDVYKHPKRHVPIGFRTTKMIQALKVWTGSTEWYNVLCKCCHQHTNLSDMKIKYMRKI